jgi:hypothetical protein
LLAGLITNFSNKRIPNVIKIEKKHKYRWHLLILFVVLRILCLSIETLEKNYFLQI